MKATLLTAALALAISAPAQAIVVTNSGLASMLANSIAGSGITISNAVLTSNTAAPAGTFTSGADSVGFDTGIVLTTGTTACVAGPNNSTNCSGVGNSTSLKFDFTSSSGSVFFNYVFASEEYNEFVGSSFNDSFQLLLNGANIALLPGAGGPVTINNVNCNLNSAYFRNNSATIGNCANQNLDTQYDGLTTVLTASAALLAGTNTFEFLIQDVGDSFFDSGVFVQTGSFSATNPDNNVPEPGSLALLGLALAGVAGVRRSTLKKA